jgi:hypothetical protein
LNIWLLLVAAVVLVPTVVVVALVDTRQLQG